MAQEMPEMPKVPWAVEQEERISVKYVQMGLKVCGTSRQAHIPMLRGGVLPPSHALSAFHFQIEAHLSPQCISEKRYQPLSNAFFQIKNETP